MPTTPPSRCTKPNCPNLATHKSRCNDHQPSGWTERPRPQDRHRTNRLQAAGITTRQWDHLTHIAYQAHAGICYWCGKPIAEADAETDHIIPIALGGARTDPDNLAPMHSACHHEKTIVDLTEMRRRADQARRGPLG